MEEQLQEQTQEESVKPAGRKRPWLLIAAIAVVGLLGLGGLGTAIGILYHNYSGYLDELNAKVAGDKAKFENGDPAADASLVDQYNFYATLSGDIGNLSPLLQQLNDDYPLLPGRASEQGTGIADLKANMAGMSDKLVTLRDCIGEDAAVSKALTDLLDSSATKDVSQDMSALAARNDALDAKISGIAFTGEFESKRAEFESGIKKRGDALHYLEEDTAVQSQLIQLLSDTQAATADTVAKLTALGQRNDALESQYPQIDLQGVAGRTIDFASLIATRRQQITAGAAYLGEIDPVRTGVANFCKTLGAPVQGSKFSEKLAGYMTYVNGLQALEDQLKTINDKPDYANLPVHRSITDLGLTTDGQTLLNYEPAVAALNSGISQSADMEKQIDSLLKNTSMKMPDKVSALEALITENTAIVNSLQALQSGMPGDLADGCASFIAACQERTTFLTDFMAYAQDKVKADGHNANYSYYLGQRTKYLQDRDYWAGLGDTEQADIYKQRADEQASLASAEKKGYNDCMSQANTDKAAYTASRTKYQALFPA